jgi:acyl-CoA synthetase (AMP-forming)/AMP-acid ligase II
VGEDQRNEFSSGPAVGAAWAGSGPATFPDYPPTVAALLRDSCRRHPDNLAVATPDARVTYRELERRSARLAALLVRHGVGKGSVVGILLPNGVEWVIAWAAITRVGGIAAPVNTFYQTPELAMMLRHADVRVLITCATLPPHDYLTRLTGIAPELERFQAPQPLMLPSFPQLRHVLLYDRAPAPAWAQQVPDLDADSPDPTLADVVQAMENDVVPSDPQLITYTSGSTGEPKGVVHGNGPLLRQGRNLAAMSGLVPSDRIWTPMPLCWVGGFSFTLLRALSVGAAFVTQARMDAGVALGLLARERVTCVSAWPAIGTTLLAHPDYPGTDLTALRLGSFSEARSSDRRPVDPSLAVTSLGMSETAGPHTFWTAAEDWTGSPEEFRGAFGHEIPGISHRIVDDAGRDVAERVEGEVLVRGYSLMLGLYKRERHDVLDADGWLHTGDRGYFDRGWFFYTGRSGDLIKTKGANVSPSEVELAIGKLPGVRQAFVFGIDQLTHDQEVVALVVPEDEGSALVAESVLLSQLRDQLSSYKIPRRIGLIDAASVPYLTSQKADRRALATIAAERFG